jgi:hypothetical protein
MEIEASSDFEVGLPVGDDTKQTTIKLMMKFEIDDDVADVPNLVTHLSLVLNQSLRAANLIFASTCTACEDEEMNEQLARLGILPPEGKADTGEELN